MGLIAAVTVDIVDTVVVDVPDRHPRHCGFRCPDALARKLSILYVVLGCGVIGAALQLSGIV